MIGVVKPIPDSNINYNVDLLIPQTKNSPRVSFNPRLNEWFVSGKSYPTDVKEFYAPILKWIDELNAGMIKFCTLRFKFEFFNTPSHLVIVKMLMRLKELKKIRPLDLKIVWYYEADDDDIMESGESIMTVVGLPFEMISYNEQSEQFGNT